MNYSLLGSSIGAFCSSLLTSLVVGFYFIQYCRTAFAARVREYVPETHRQKDGTPTMGGLYILGSMGINAFLWCRFTTCFVWVIFFAMCGFGGIGLIDDWYKIRYQAGIHARHKFIMQWLVAFITVVLLVHRCGLPTTVSLPGDAWHTYALSMFFYIWASFILVSASNAVNLTDGVDGLASAAYIPCMLFFVFLFSLLAQSPLTLPHISIIDASMLAVFSAVVCGSILGFLWYNAYPARLFMGDVGSLSLGAGLAAIALVAKLELLLPVIAFVFVVEVLSVIAQVASFKYRGKRIIKRSPLHHHFELCGIHENTITMRAFIISCIACSFAACCMVYVISTL